MKSMSNSYPTIVRLHDLIGRRLRMVQCIEEEPDPPTDPLELEEWCELGKSARPIQTHIGDCGIVDKIVNEEALLVLFDDGDERIVYVDEVYPLPNGACG